jgi:superoxide dismutase
MATCTLPDLPYDYGALAPPLSGQIMELHRTIRVAVEDCSTLSTGAS